MTLPIVERLREPWTQEQSRRPATEHEAADTIEELMEVLNLAAKRLSQAGVEGASRSTVKEWANEALAFLAKIGGDAMTRIRWWHAPILIVAAAAMAQIWRAFA